MLHVEQVSAAASLGGISIGVKRVKVKTISVKSAVFLSIPISFEIFSRIAMGRQVKKCVAFCGNPLILI